MPNITPQDLDAKIIAYYLPQFHIIPENSLWWGEDFTEWTNVKKATPLFDNHYQPRIPHNDIGYYNLLDSNIQQKQIEIAKSYGIFGFCYYYYWFHGKKLLEKPLENFLANSKLDFPFCIMWANHSWTTEWNDGGSHHIIDMTYSTEDDIEFINSIIPFFQDNRYIYIENRPLFIIFQPHDIPNINKTISIWREICNKHKINNPYIVYLQFVGVNVPKLLDIKCDAFSDFNVCGFSSSYCKTTLGLNPLRLDYRELVTLELAKAKHNLCVDHHFNSFRRSQGPYLRSATVGWDNTPRYGRRGQIYLYNEPDIFKKWIYNLVNISYKNSKIYSIPNVIFINAWNEWAEGSYLEPDTKYNYEYLQTIKESI